jgi:hypothetical protein
MDIYLVITLIIFSFLILCIFIDDITFTRIGLYFSIFILLKWVFNYRACTFGYYECKIRNVKKNKGFINNFCEYFGDLIYSEYNYIYFIILLIIYFSNLVKFYIFSKDFLEN